MERALRKALVEEVPELTGEVYPTNAPETSSKPYMVYMRISTDKIKDLDGYTGTEHISYMFNIMATKYSEMKSLTKRVEDFLMSLLKTQLDEFYIEDLTINNIHEDYEHQLNINRGIIDFTIYFEEE